MRSSLCGLTGRPASSNSRTMTRARVSTGRSRLLWRGLNFNRSGIGGCATFIVFPLENEKGRRLPSGPPVLRWPSLFGGLCGQAQQLLAPVLQAQVGGLGRQDAIGAVPD